MTGARFSLGSLATTPCAMAVLAAAKQSPAALLVRHASGDWGELCAEDARLNDRAVRRGGSLLSAYTVGGVRLWVITESDRASTCLLRADEY